MRHVVLAIIFAALLVVTGAFGDEAGLPLEAQPIDAGSDVAEAKQESLHDRFVQAVLKSRSIKQKNGDRKPYWYECGKRVKTDAKRRQRASEWATWVLKSIDEAEAEHGVELNPWGVLAVAHNESGFNVCAIDLQTREWAVSEGLVKNLQLTYDRETIYKIISSKQFQRTRIKADFGPLQVRRKGDISRQLLDQILSLDPGMIWAAKEMAKRSVNNPVGLNGDRKPHPRPWRLWPTSNPRSTRSFKYDRHITRVAKWLGAETDEI